MRIKLVAMFLGLMVVCFSCREIRNDHVDNGKLNSFISSYDKTDFTKFKNAFIGIRQKKGKDITYIIQNITKNLPVYLVTYDEVRNVIIKIDRTALAKSNIEDYYTEEEIGGLIQSFRKYDFALIQVDSNDNVFINPWEINTPALLLRLNEFPPKEDTVRKGYVYKKYKDNWYIKK